MDAEALEKLRMAVGQGAMVSMDIFNNEAFADALVDCVVHLNRLNQLMTDEGFSRARRANFLIGIGAVVGLGDDET